jgi:heme-degrading monooxygenase HmoA
MQTYWKDNKAPTPPYYAVIFISEKKEDLSGYEEMNNRAMEGALAMPGCLGYSSVPGNFISYWDSQESINAWRHNATHKEAKEKGVKNWYKYYHSLICKVEHSHEFLAAD